MKCLEKSPIILLLFGMLLFSNPAEAQMDTSKTCSGDECCVMKCLKNKNFSPSSFGSAMLTGTNMGVGKGFAYGGGGGLLMDCGLFIGAFGKGGSVSKRSEAFNGEEVDLSTGYGGIWLGGHPFKDKVIHPKWGLQIGYGSVDGTIDEYVDGKYDLKVMKDDIFVISPDLGIGVNVTDNLMLDLSAGYRVVKGLEKNEKLGLRKDDLNGFQGKVGVVFSSN